MTDGKKTVVPLKGVPSNISAEALDVGYLSAIQLFLRDEEILDEYADEDVELQPARPDERKLGPLTSLEKDLFIIGSLIAEIIRNEIVEIEANGTDAIVRIMRERRITTVEAATIYAQTSPSVPEDTRIFLNKCAATQANALSMYEWGVRARYTSWNNRIVVRRGFVAHSYKHHG